MKANVEHSGFTIIELIVVLVLVGITSAVIISRFAEPNSFTVQAAQDGLISTIRAAQQAALGRSGVTFEINDAGGEWQLEAKDSGTTIRAMDISASNVLLETGSAATSGDTCASGFDDSMESDFELSFDGKGNLTQFVNDGNLETVDSTFNGVRICVNDTDEESVCVSPAGYAYVGNCDD